MPNDKIFELIYDQIRNCINRLIEIMGISHYCTLPKKVLFRAPLMIIRFLEARGAILYMINKLGGGGGRLFFGKDSKIFKST